jgi:hypothetical protein
MSRYNARERSSLQLCQSVLAACWCATFRRIVYSSLQKLPNICIGSVRGRGLSLCRQTTCGEVFCRANECDDFRIKTGSST